MALTPSRMLALDAELPEFDLCDGAGNRTRSSDFAAKPVLVTFICNHCPYVVHIKPQLAQLGHDLLERGVAMVAISANDPTSHPADGPSKMEEDRQRYGYPFAYLFDETQAIARAFEAVCTPEFYLFDAAHHLVYRGQLDGSRPGSGTPVTGHDVRNAVDALLAGRPISADQVPSVGCNIKWRPENRPA